MSFATMSPEARYQIARLGAAAANARRTPERRAEIARAASAASIAKSTRVMAGKRVLIRKTPLCYVLTQDTEAVVVRSHGAVLRVRLPGGSLYWVSRSRCEVIHG